MEDDEMKTIGRTPPFLTLCIICGICGIIYDSWGFEITVMGLLIGILFKLNRMCK